MRERVRDRCVWRAPLALNSLTVIATFSFFRPMSVRLFFLFDVSIFTCRAAVALINEIVLINFTSHVAETTAAKKCGEELDDPLTNIS